jgi:sugar lactone lactonase YvrE
MRLDADMTATRVFGDMTISNGLAWSPDGATMYHADTPKRRIDAYDYDVATATPRSRRTLAQFAGETERPDGGTVDSDGCYWSAFYRGGRVVRISPDGRLLADYPVPAMCPTMCAFGGRDLKTVYLTTARQERPDEELARFPQSGSLFAMNVDTPGVPEPMFAG